MSTPIPPHTSSHPHTPPRPLQACHPPPYSEGPTPLYTSTQTHSRCINNNITWYLYHNDSTDYTPSPVPTSPYPLHLHTPPTPLHLHILPTPTPQYPYSFTPYSSKHLPLYTPTPPYTPTLLHPYISTPLLLYTPYTPYPSTH